MGGERLKKRWTKRLTKPTNKQGMSGMAWMLITIGVLFMLYVPTDITMRAILGQELNGIMDNAVSAAVTQIEEDDIASGEVTIDPLRAERTIYEVIGYAYGLEVQEEVSGGRVRFSFDESGLSDSKLHALPELEFQHIGFTRHEVNVGTLKNSAPFDDGSIFTGMSNDSVVIRVSVEYPTLFLNFLGGMEVSRISAAQAQLTPAAPGG